MATDFDKFAARLAHSLAALSRRVKEQIPCQKIAGEDADYTFRFQIDAQTLRDLAAVLNEDRRLWTDFQNAIRAHQVDRHWRALVEFASEIGYLHGRLRNLEHGFSCRCLEYRRRLAIVLNCLEGEIAVRHVLADRRNLAGRVNKIAGYPVIDGLTMRGLTFDLAEHLDLWREFQALVERTLHRTERCSDRFP
jgi:hypothetical protein